VGWGWQPVAWADAVLTGVTIQAVHLQQLREALTAAYLAAIPKGRTEALMRIRGYRETKNPSKENGWRKRPPPIRSVA
jgi:hypothetical protein